MLTFILVIIVISILVLAHELGHFYAARFLKIRVEEFGFGFPPKLWSRVKNGIRYSVNWLPFGGYVKIYGEHGEGEDNKDSFASRPAWQRFVVLAAGVFMNLVLAWVLFSAGSMAGIPEAVDESTEVLPVSIIEVLPNTPAEQAGLKFGDKIVEMRDIKTSLPISTEQDVRNFTDTHRGEEITLVIRRGQNLQEIKATPRKDIAANEGSLGIALARISLRQVPWYKAPIEGFKMLYNSLFLTILGLAELLKNLVMERKMVAAVAGPVGIFFLVNDTRMLGLAYLTQFVGILSVNLAVLNFLPIPALDGGRVLFLIIEKIRGKKVKVEWENLAHLISFALLIALMVLVTYRDIVRIF